MCGQGVLCVWIGVLCVDRCVVCVDRCGVCVVWLGICFSPIFVAVVCHGPEQSISP